MTLIKTFKLRNKMEIDIFVNNELLLTITRPISKNDNTIDFNEFIHFDLLDGTAEMYTDTNKPNSFIYYTSSCGNQMALILTKNEANEFLKLTYLEFDSESDSDYTDTDTNTNTDTETPVETPVETHKETSVETPVETPVETHKETSAELLKYNVIDRKNHPTDKNYYIYMIDINLPCPITCVSAKYYKIGDLVNVAIYDGEKGFYVKGVYSNGIISEKEIETIKTHHEINPRFSSWFGF